MTQKTAQSFLLYSNIENDISKIDTVGNLFEHCSKTRFIFQDKGNLEQQTRTSADNRRLRMIRALAATSNTIADFIHKLRFEKYLLPPKS
jgi:hypothetical protein